ncbi:MAG: DUF4397 domain-containing protein [Clostridium butyricum]|nr:DUF4397 domain-containing protein [Clostridium butyricum]
MYMFKDSLPRLDGKIRFLHAIPDAPSVDVYANGKLIYSNLSFGQITNYISIAPGTYNIKLLKTGTTNNDVFSDSINITPNSISTVAVTYENNEIEYFTIDDSHIPESNPMLSFIRFINLSANAPLLSLSIPSGIVFFNQASYLETNGYYPTSPGIYDFIVSSADGNFNKYISSLNLTPNLFITIYIIGSYISSPSLGYILIKDGTEQRNIEEL